MSLEVVIANLAISAMGKLLNSTQSERTQFVEGMILLGHHDSFAYTLPDGRPGIVKLSQWPICWSVKWYSLDATEQVVLADRIGEKEAREVFARLHDELMGKERAE